MHVRQTHTCSSSRTLASLLLGASLFLPALSLAQQPAGAGTSKTSLPDSPQPKQEATEPSGAKVVGYLTNRSFFFPDIAASPGPIGPGGKFKIFVNQSISPGYILASGISAAFNQARNSPKAYGQGWQAYADRFGESVARASSTSFFGTFVFASVLHEDPRFFPQYQPTFWGSVKYSARRLVISQKDSGLTTIDYSGLLGPAFAEGLANAYLPNTEQTAAKTLERYGTDMGWRFAANMFKNYWPVFFHDLGLNRLKVIPNPGSPEHPVPQT